MNQDPLTQLRDIHLPAPIGWWPPAPGWWILALLVLGLSGWGTYLLMPLYRKKRHRKAALNELILLKQNTDHRFVLEQIAVLLRRVAIQSFGREVAAGLSGQKWLDFLDRTGGTNQFNNGPGVALRDTLYQSDGDVMIEPLIEVSERWIRRHKQC